MKSKKETESVEKLLRELIKEIKEVKLLLKSMSTTTIHYYYPNSPIVWYPPYTTGDFLPFADYDGDNSTSHFVSDNSSITNIQP